MTRYNFSLSTFYFPLSKGTDRIGKSMELCFAVAKTLYREKLGVCHKANKASLDPSPPLSFSYHQLLLFSCPPGQNELLSRH